MRKIIRSSWLGHYNVPFSFRLLSLTIFLLLSTPAHTAAPDPQCKPDSIMVSGFESGSSLLFEDTFEGCRSSLWQESDGDWQVASGAYYTTVFSSANVLPLQPDDFIVELEVSDIQGGGLWLRLDNGTGVILQVGSTASDSFLYWQAMNAGVLGPTLNQSANGVINPGNGDHTIKVIVESGTYQAFVDGKLATTLTHADIIASGRTPPDNGAVGLQGQGTSTRFNRIRIWGENRSTAQIVFTTDQSVLLESIGQSYQFSAQVVDSLGAVIPDIDLQWSLQANALVSMTASGGGSATVEVDSLGLDTLNLIVSAPSLQISNQAQIMLADLAPDAVYLDSNVVIDNGYGGGNVILHRNAKTELIQVGDVLVSGDEAGLLVRVLTVTLTADQVILTVEPAKITDAFRNLNIAGASQAQSLSVHFDAETNRVTVASLVAGDATTQSTVVDGLECKTEDQTDFGLDLSGGSIDWDIQEELFATLSIEEYVVQEFSFYTTQSLSLKSSTGSLSFSSTLAGTVTCEIPIDKIETPSVPLSVFSFGLGIQPIIGVRVSGTINGPSFTIQGPSASLQGSATEGIKYTLGGGWVPVGNLTWGGSTEPFSAEFKHGVEFAIDAGAFGGINFDLTANLGRGKFLSYELATVEFAELNSDATLSTAFASPFDPLLKSYTGPKWGVKANLESLYKAELTGGALQTLLERLDVPTTLPFGGEIFTPMEVDLVHSPVINLSWNCVPANCVLNSDEPSHEATLITNTDDDESGKVQYLVSIDGSNNLQPLTSATLSTGSSSTNWSPVADDPEGKYEVYARLDTDALSELFPYASDTPAKLYVGVAPEILLADLEFPDSQLKACVLAQVPVLTVADLTYLGCRNYVITDITGMEQLTSLREVSFYKSPITDLSVLSTLSELRRLDLTYSQIADLSTLSSVTQLTELNLEHNQITDISALSTLTQLTRLNLQYNEITSVSSPLGALSQLKYLDLNSNSITDISALSTLTQLTELDLNRNQITGISALSTLTQLTRLDLHYNEITSVSSPLGALTQLKYLDLSSNLITDISALSTLTQLPDLKLYKNQITDISALSTLTQLTTLSLGDNQITDISALSTLTQLRWLGLSLNSITDLSPLSTLTQLWRLFLYDNEITDVSALSILTQLVWLSLYYNQISDISALSTLTQLSYFHVYGNNQEIPCSQLASFSWVENFEYEPYFDADGNGERNVPPDEVCGPY